MVVYELAKFPLFQDLDSTSLQVIAPLVNPYKYTKGQTIFEQGDPAAYFYIVVSGEVEVRFKPYDAPVMTVAHVTSGGVFGWSAALGHVYYTSAAVSLTDCSLYRMDGAGLQSLCAGHTQVGDVIIETLAGVVADRLRRGHTGICNILTQANDV